MVYKDRYNELERYITSGEPEMKERARNRSTTFGLQAVNELRQSEFFTCRS